MIGVCPSDNTLFLLNLFNAADEYNLCHIMLDNVTLLDFVRAFVQCILYFTSKTDQYDLEK